jgi:hypothetical protein
VNLKPQEIEQQSVEKIESMCCGMSSFFFPRLIFKIVLKEHVEKGKTRKDALSSLLGYSTFTGTTDLVV